MLYWSDWEMEAILKVSQFPTKAVRNVNVTRAVMHVISPMDVHIYHELRQPRAVSFTFKTVAST
jgi:hypothetical protein